MDVGCCQEALCPVNFHTLAQVGLEQLVLRSSLLPSHQESSSTQLQSIHFFRAVMSRLFAAREKEQLKTHVRQSVIPLFFHLHDENQQVAEVGFSAQRGHLGRAMLTPRGGTEHPQEGRSRGLCCHPCSLHPAPAPSGTTPRSRRLLPVVSLPHTAPWAVQRRAAPAASPRGWGHRSPESWGCHFKVSAALQAAEETLLDAAKFLQRTQLVDLLERKQTWRLGKCLVRTALKAPTQTGQAHSAPGHGAGSCPRGRLCTSPMPLRSLLCSWRTTAWVSTCARACRTCRARRSPCDWRLSRSSVSPSPGVPLCPREGGGGGPASRASGG